MRFNPYISRLIQRLRLLLGLRGSLAADPTARMLHVLLVTLALWVIAAWVATIPFAPVSLPRLIYPVGLILSYVIALVLLRVGHFRRASLTFLAGMWLWGTLVSYSFGGVHSAGALLYVSLPASAAWLLGSTAAVWTAGWCVLGALAFTVLEMTHVSLGFQAIATPLGVWTVIVQAVLINAIPVGQIISRLREGQERLVSIYNTVEDVIFHLALEGEGQFRFLSVNAAFLKMTGLRREDVVGKTVHQVIPEPSLTMVLGKYRQAIEGKTVVRWEETSDYPAGRLSGAVNVAPVFDDSGVCTHLVGSVHDISDTKHAQEIESQLRWDLERGRDEIRALAASLMQAQEDERRRISRDLHDQICQQLAVLALEIGELSNRPLPPENMGTHLAAIRERVVKTSHETHHIAYQMHTAILDDLGLAASLKDLCRQFSERHPDILVDFKDGSLPGSIPREVASCLYRVAQEGLQNVAKHANAKRVSVRLDFRTRAMVLTIHDDGAGFDRKAVKGGGGLGLIGMEERVRSVRGKLTITSAPNHGTHIGLDVPLPADNL